MPNKNGFFDFLGKAAVGALIGVFATNSEFRNKCTSTARKGRDAIKTRITKKKDEKKSEKSE